MLEEAEVAFQAAGIAFQGLRYSRIDDRKNAFDHNLATLQFFAYINENLLLTDEEAIQIRQNTHDIDYETLLDKWILIQASHNSDFLTTNIPQENL